MYSSSDTIFARVLLRAASGAGAGAAGDTEAAAAAAAEEGGAWHRGCEWRYAACQCRHTSHSGARTDEERSHPPRHSPVLAADARLAAPVHTAPAAPETNPASS